MEYEAFKEIINRNLEQGACINYLFVTYDLSILSPCNDCDGIHFCPEKLGKGAFNSKELEVITQHLFECNNATKEKRYESNILKVSPEKLARDGY